MKSKLREAHRLKMLVRSKQPKKRIDYLKEWQRIQSIKKRIEEDIKFNSKYNELIGT